MVLNKSDVSLVFSTDCLAKGFSTLPAELPFLLVALRLWTTPVCSTPPCRLDDFVSLEHPVDDLIVVLADEHVSPLVDVHAFDLLVGEEVYIEQPARLPVAEATDHILVRLLGLYSIRVTSIGGTYRESIHQLHFDMTPVSQQPH